MLKNLSQSKTAVKIVLGGVLLLICGAMVITLAPTSPLGTVGSPDAVATIGGENITAIDVQQEFSQQTRGQNVPPVLQGIYMRQVLDQMVFKRILAMEADRLGIQVTNDEITQRIKQILPTAFIGDTWIGADRYAQEVEMRTGMSVPQFEDYVRTALLTEKFKDLVTDGITVSPEELQERYRWLNEKVQLEYAEIKASDLESTINPTDTELSSYFAKNQSKYQVPERRSALYALLDLNQLKQSLKISDADIQSYYQQHIADYKVENRVHVEHLSFNILGKTDAEVALAKQQAQKIDDQAKHGGNFEDLAKKYSEDTNTKAKGGDLGWIVSGQTAPAFEKAAFSLPKGGVSDVVQTPYSFDIIKVVDREDAHTKALAEVQDSIVQTLTQEKVNDEETTISDKMAAAIRQSNHQPLDAIAKEFNLETGETPLVDLTGSVGDLGDSQDLKEALFSLHQGELSQPISIDRGYVIITVDKVVAAHQGTLAEVHDRVLADYRQEKAQDIALQKAAELAKRVKAGEPLDKVAKSLGLTVKTTDSITRTSQVADLGPAKNLESAFNMSVGQSSDPVQVAGNWVVFQLKAKQDVNPEDFAKARADLEQQILTDKQNIAFEAFHDALMKRYQDEGKLVFNQANLKVLTSPASS